MANPNVTALERLLGEAEGSVDGGRTAKLVSPVAVKALAQWLATCATPVLVISRAVLTDDVCERLVHDGPDHYEGDWEAEPDQVRARLFRLAKGEPNG